MSACMRNKHNESIMIMTTVTSITMWFFEHRGIAQFFSIMCQGLVVSLINKHKLFIIFLWFMGIQIEGQVA